jgi:hypothetical protein
MNSTHAPSVAALLLTLFSPVVLADGPSAPVEVTEAMVKDAAHVIRGATHEVQAVTSSVTTEVERSIPPPSTFGLPWMVVGSVAVVGSAVWIVHRRRRQSRG